jgi:hypothetical protein
MVLLKFTAVERIKRVILSDAKDPFRMDRDPSLRSG